MKARSLLSRFRPFVPSLGGFASITDGDRQSLCFVGNEVHCPGTGNRSELGLVDRRVPVHCVLVLELKLERLLEGVLLVY